VVCLLDELWGEMFEALKDESVFATALVTADFGIVTDRFVIMAGDAGTRLWLLSRAGSMRAASWA
jgi:hypothetical protein